MKLTPAGEECLATALTPGWRRLANIMLALLVLAVTAYGFMMIRLVLHRPYAGFGVYPFNRVAYLDRHGPADRAGLREGMLIVTMNGERVGSVLDTVRQLEALQPGGEVVLQVKSGQGAAISTIRIKLEKPPLPTFLIFATFAYLVFISLALFVYYRRPDDPPVVAFAMVTLTGFISMLTSFAFRETIAYPVVNIVRIWSSLITFPLILHFALRFPVTHEWVRGRPFVQVLIYVPAVAFAGYLTVRSMALFDAALDPTLVHEILQDILWVSTRTMFLALAYLLSGFYVLARSYRRGTPQIRTQIRTLLIGSLIGIFPMSVLIYEGVTNYARFLLGGLNPPLTITFALALLVPTGLSLVRYRLTDVNDALMRSFLYVTVFMIVIGLYIAIEGTLVSVFEFLLNERWTSVSRYLAIIAVAFLFKPIHDALYMLTDRTINPRRQRYRQRLQQVSDSLTSLMELDDLGEKMVSSLSDALETPVVALFVVSESADRRVVQPLAVRGLKETNLGDLALKIPFLLDELEKGAVISRRMLLKKVPHRPYLAQLDVLEAVLLIPILSERTLSGFIALGEHSAGADYSAAARELLQALARHAAVAIENARAYQKIAGLNEQLQSQIEKIEKQREQILVLQERLLEENVQLKEVISKPFAAGSIIGSSPSIREVLKMVEKVAATDSAVLLIGESGTGKELFAQALHENSNRRDKPFIKVNCAALAESLLESELFGHEKGSFTGAHQRKLGRFELAHGGTLFLDEIGELSSNLQAKLLRALQEKEFDRVGGTKSIKVDVRIIAATNRNLEAEVQRGGFREDLYYRLNVIRIIIPPLRDRHRDIIDLAMHFLNQSNKKTGKRIRHIEERALDALLAYDWPGNVRELENLIERAVVLSDGPALGLHDFPIEIADALDHPTHPGPPNLQSPNNHPTAAPAEAPLPEILENMERETLLRALQDCQGNKSEAARRLGLARSTFFNKLRKFGLA